MVSDTDDDDESPSLPPMRPTRTPLLRARGAARSPESRLRVLREMGALPTPRPARDGRASHSGE